MTFQFFNRNISKLTLAILAGFTISACDTDKQESTKAEVVKPETLFTSMMPEQTGIDFVNTVVNQKNFNIFKYRNFYNGGKKKKKTKRKSD